MKRFQIVAAAAILIGQASGAEATSTSYSGRYEVFLTHDVYVTNDGYKKGPNSTHCVVLSDYGNGGWIHSGGALVDNTYSGQFMVIGRSILISVGVPGGEGEDAVWFFSSPASKGDIDQKGNFDNVLGGESYSSADASFGTKGSC